MEISYRYLKSETVNAEIETMLTTAEFDVNEALSKMDFDRNSFAGAVIGVERLLEIRAELLAAFALDSNALLIGPVSASEFDERVTKVILSVFRDLTPYEASQKEVWAYLTLRLLPDFAKARFPHHALERYAGGERNVFRRIWQRAFILGGDLASELQEDEHIKIFERGLSIGSNRTIATCLAYKAIEMRTNSKTSGETIKSSKIINDAAKSLKRRLTVLNIQAMTEGQIKEIIEFEMEKAKAALDVQVD